jgi:hypothetical protein
MTIAALQRLLDEELPHVRRLPAPRLNLPYWSAKEHDTMTDTDRPDAPPTPSGDTLADTLAWAHHHTDPDVQALGEQSRVALAALYERRDRDAELARIQKELAEVDARAEQLRARQAELVPAVKRRGKARPQRDYDPGEVRTWARAHGYQVPDRGVIPTAALTAWRNRDQAEG